MFPQGPWLNEMKKDRPPDPPRKRMPDPYGQRVPRPIHKWLQGLLDGDWQGTFGPAWAIRAARIAEPFGCTLIYDPDHHWRESCYIMRNNVFGRKTILLGGASATETIGLSIFAHELAHHVLVKRGQEPSDLVLLERRTWEIAAELAAQFNLPSCSKTRRRALYGYRYAALLWDTVGSKRRTRKPKAQKSARLLGSKESAEANVAGFGLLPLGKRGKRGTKRDIKSATRKALRRRRIDED